MCYQDESLYFWVLFGMDFDPPPDEAHISRVHQENGMVEGYFYVVALEFRLKFLLPDFIVEVLNDYGIALS